MQECVSKYFNYFRLAEVVFLLKKKLESKNPKVVLMTLHLLEALVKNGNSLIHGTIGNDFLMATMANVARKYNGKTGSENREVAELCLDIIQAWGEGFMFKQQQFPAFTKYYVELRKEGLHFNPQFDASKMPDFAPPSDSGTSTGNQQAEDEALAAALAASLSGGSYQEERYRPSDENRYHSESYQESYSNRAPAPAPSHLNAGSPSELINSVSSSVALLQDLISVSPSQYELRNNDIAREVAEQLRGYLPKLVSAIDSAVVSQPEVRFNKFLSV